MDDTSLGAELDVWAAAGRKARLWWRDDDAASDTPELRTLLAIAGDAGVVPSIAVVPQQADESLLRLLSTAECCIWQHGWGHHFHEDGEFGEGRPLGALMDDARAGQRAMDGLFGSTGWQRVFVPPNHALSLAFKMLIPTLGYLGVSAGAPLSPPVRGVVEANAIDLMDWRLGRLSDASVLTDLLVGELASRRRGEASDHPIGLLTHHRAFDGDAWEYFAALLRFLGSHPAVELVRGDALFTEAAECPKTRQLAGSADRAEGVATADGEAEITVVVTSCGRQDLLAVTLDSFFKYNSHPIRGLIVIEDGPSDANRALEERYRQHRVRWIGTGARVGQIAAIDAAYRHVDSEYIFHCEDDWEFSRTGFIERSLSVLRRNPAILQVWLRALADTNGHPVLKQDLLADDVSYRLLRPGYHTEEWGTWHGFSFNPGLRRRSDYTALGSFGALDPDQRRAAWEIERAASEFYLARGLFAAILADDDAKGYVRHIGWGRRVGEPERKP